MANFCTSCGSPLNKDARFCRACGTPVRSNKQGQPQNFAPYQGQGVKKKSAFLPLLITFSTLIVLGLLGFFVLFPILKGDGAKIASKIPDEPDKLFAYGFEQTMFDFYKKSENISSARFNFLLKPDDYIPSKESDHTNYSLRLSPEGSEEELLINMETIYDPKKGDSSLAIEARGLDDTELKSGVYFVGDSMIFRRSDIEKPMIRYDLNPEVSKSFKDITAMDRFLRLVGGPETEKLGDSEWHEATKEFTDLAISLVGSDNFNESQASINVIGHDLELKGVEFSLRGPDAEMLISEFAHLIEKDSNLHSFFIYEIEDDEDDWDDDDDWDDWEDWEDDEDINTAPGMKGLLAFLESLSPEEKSTLSLNFNVMAHKGYNRISMDVLSNSRNMSLLLSFFEEGEERENIIDYKGFDEGGIRTYNSTISEGGDNYLAKTEYKTLSVPSGGSGQSIYIGDISSRYTKTRDDYKARIDFNYTDKSDFSNQEIIGQMDMVQTSSAKKSITEAEGILSILDDEGTNINFFINMESDDKALVSPPDFIEGSGVIIDNEDDFFRELGGGFIDKDMIDSSPLYAKPMLFFFIMFY